jgi:hypothetical protein
MNRRLGMRLLAGFAALALPALGSAQPVVGLVFDGCATQVNSRTAMGEVYAVKIKGAQNNYTDWLFDATTKGGLSAPGVDVGDGAHNIPPNWQAGINAGEIVFVYVTYPNGFIAIDANEPLGTGGDFGAVIRQKVGDSIASNIAGTPTDGIDLTLSSSTSGTTIDMNGALAGGTANYPFGANGGIEAAFGALAELNPLDLVGGAGCTVSGTDPDPQTGRGNIIGYNVYRMVDSSGGATVPTVAQLGTVANFQYFIPYSFNLGSGDDTGATGPNEPNPGTNDPVLDDLAGLQNLDALAHSGDEVLIFQDSVTGRTRISGTPPDITGATDYWYAVQPVVGGSVNGANPGAPGNTNPYWQSNNDNPPTAKCLAINFVLCGDHRMDLDSDGRFDAINLDLDAGNSPEFFSPQAEVGALPGLPGLGLTHNGLPLLSTPVWGSANPAAGLGQVTLNATFAGADVNISFSTALETGNVQGFNVYRVIGETRVRVNPELIPARGGEGNVYTLVDQAARPTSRRTTRGTVEYMVEVVYDDGTANRMVGPFQVSADREPARRR